MSEIGLYIHSRKKDKTYRIKKFTEYSVDTDLESDADGFNILFPNVGGEYNMMFSRFDVVKITVNDQDLLKGYIDTVEYKVSDSENCIQITGRDKASALLDNDALPDTIKNVNPAKYIAGRCNIYGIKYSALYNTSIVSELSIGTGESELSIMSNLLLNDKQRLWFLYDTLYSGKWNTNAKPLYTFTRGKTGLKGIRIESISYKEDGRDMKSEVRIYGSMNDGSDKVVGTAKNPYMIKRNIPRRTTKRSSNNDTSTKYSASALEDVRDSFRNNVTIEIQVYVGGNFFIPNTTAKVVDKELLGINGTYFIRSVSYSMSVNSGSVATITMIPDDATFDIIWKKQ